jgi:hypothetical protein
MYVSHCQVALSGSSQPSAGFCIAIQTVSQYFAFAPMVSNVVNVGKFMKKY